MTKRTASLIMMSVMQFVFSDQVWSVWETLIEDSTRRARIFALFWRHQNGAKWRVVPTEFGPWWIAAQFVVRLSRLGVWLRLFDKIKDRDQALVHGLS
ncbi:transposase [Komagataeibacter europaeus]|uniref:transposase n=1 Tax=Komagataeibacter europaeus TaxID=33995 RepID=UPI000B3E9B14|nr:transposase [Komagataeibacter europaeus]ARW18358.1 hypothetical protein S101446_03284 [Komagataeibacter europaeus]